jgi:PilZ domain
MPQTTTADHSCEPAHPGDLLALVPERSPGGTERRAWTRYPTNLEIFCRPAVGGAEMCWSGHIRNLSRGGLQLRMHRRFSPGALLKIDIPALFEDPGAYLILRVIYATLQSDGSWALGGALTQELDEDDLATILHTPANHLPAD